MFATTMLTVIFATRGAMAGNRHIVEVLHFVGAETSFIASEFQKRFLLIGLKGAAFGGGVATLGLPAARRLAVELDGNRRSMIR
jgi:cell division transport system permease protein